MKTRLVLVALVIVGFIFFREPLLQIFGLSSAPGYSEVDQSGQPLDDETGAFLATLIGDNERVWPAILGAEQVQFRPARMVIYSQRTRTPGGLADARMGPFYLPQDETIYIDPYFFSELKQRFGAAGDFAEAYVVAHEYGHHIEQLLGRLDQLHSSRGRVSETEYNRGSVRVELHADFLAGVFAHHAERTFKAFLDEGDIEEAMAAAEAIGDDRIQQKQDPGYVDPDSFTHGTSEQRARWFNLGFQSGDLEVGEQLYTLPYDRL